jgi:hypothetical protein
MLLGFREKLTVESGSTNNITRANTGNRKKLLMHGVRRHVASIVKTEHYSCGKFEISTAVMFGIL